MEQTLENARKKQTEKIRRQKLKTYDKCQKKIEQQIDQIRRNPQKYKNKLLAQAKNRRYLVVNLTRLPTVYKMSLFDSRQISPDKFESRIYKMLDLYQTEIKELLDHPRCFLYIFSVGISDYQLAIGVGGK